MKKIIFGILFVAAVVTFADKPNLIVILCDDMGYADVGFNGCKDIPTPNIDRIAKNGVQCTSGYVAYSVCGPSRAGLMTGRYEQRFGFERNPQYQPNDPNMGVPLSEHTLADVLKKAGYTSGAIGKWHLGAYPTLHPLNRGFDFFYGHLGGGHRYFPEELTIKRSEDATGETESYQTWILRNHEPDPPTQYLTDAFSDEAVGFVERSKDQPFFLYLAYNAPHNPLQATEKYLSRFKNIKNEKRRTYAAMVSAIDDGVGLLLNKLDELNLTDNTLIFFLSDNGGPETKNASDNGPLRGQKSDVWEGGFRVPYAVQWKGTLPAGAKYDEPVSSLDIFATIADLAQAPLDPQRPLDGVNLIPYLTGKEPGVPHEAIYLRKFDQGRYAVRHGDYKLVIPFSGGTAQLYNLEEDIGEEQDIASAHPEKMKELDQLRLKWDSQLIEPRFLGLTQSADWIKHHPPKKSDKPNAKSAKKASVAKWDWFAALDKNKDRGVTEDEWLEWSMKESKKKNRNTSEGQQKQYFASRDANGDGMITREELEASKRK
ncbi:sulfatase-like hydrolase/transferase [Pontiella sulfatireligans]|uniref:Arylsulfatase n=1 Tax=Pontiella sulfatireligans TaxID=2750658 RepID=A0A6C2UI03_9BACT|nr:sulfatase-like hydrolase/transferase [Pontiella sulfatireligans]SPS74391.1 sulfatase S1_19 [Kiritimatiellales bacterium]VGO19758.1 Arylsulfatase [Pontiella sulfatireligans]